MEKSAKIYDNKHFMFIVYTLALLISVTSLITLI